MGRRYFERLDTKAVRLIRVSEYRTANALIPHESADAGKRYIQTHRLRQLGREQAELHLAGATGFSSEYEHNNRRLWWMRLKIKLQQLEPEGTVIRR